MNKTWTALMATATGGLCAGVLLGMIEIGSLALLNDRWSGLSVLFWATAVYGLLGLLAGAALGIAASLALGRWLPSGGNWWMLMGGTAILSGAGLIVMRYRLLRDLFQERTSLASPAGLALHAGLLAVCGGILALAWWIGRRWTRAAPSAGPSTPDTGTPVSRRTFLKAGFASGVVAIPAMAAASRLLEPKPAAPTALHRTGLPAALRAKPNVLFIVTDTLRADHLGIYGYASANTPHMDSLAGDSIRFANVLSQSSWTKPSIATMLTSLYPSSHTAIYKNSVLPAAATTLAEVLNAYGYITGGLANNVNVAPLFNFHKGFADYTFLAPDYLLGASEASSELAIYQTARMLNERFVRSRKNVHNFYQPADVINERAMQWIRSRQDDRFFLFLHYMEPHDPYFEHPYNGYGIARVSTPQPAPDLAAEMVRLYDGEIAYLDRQLGELFAWLKQQGLYDETLIVLTADHGEEFYEHGGWWHGLTLYQEQIHVPLFLKLPGQKLAGALDTGLARSLDLAPTVLRAVGLDIPQAMQGVDLLGETARAQLCFAEEDFEGNVLRAISGPTWKLIQADPGNPRGLPALSLYQLVQDPGETQDRHRSEPDVTARMQEHLETAASLALAQAVTGNQVALDQATLEQLRSLGY